jgi:uncharacterized protein YjbI with pentapeptide repeats
MKHSNLMSALLLLSIELVAYNAHHASKVLQKVKSGQFVNASHCDFRGLGLLFKGLNLSGAQLSGVLFDIQNKQNSDLSGVNFSNATLVSTSFKGANLKNANFSNADVCYADFSGADLTGALLDKAKNVNLALFCKATMPDGTKPVGATWTSKSGKVIQLHCST